MLVAEFAGEERFVRREVEQAVTGKIEEDHTLLAGFTGGDGPGHAGPDHHEAASRTSPDDKARDFVGRTSLGDIDLSDDGQMMIDMSSEASLQMSDAPSAGAQSLVSLWQTGGIGVHRFDMDANYAYISTEMAGFMGNVLVIYDIRKRTFYGVSHGAEKLVPTL